MTVEEITPCPVAYPHGARSIHDIGKQHRGQDAIDFGNVSLPGHKLSDLTHDGSRIPNPPKVIPTIKLRNPCTSMTGKIAALFNVYSAVAGDGLQSRHMDCGQDRANVDSPVHAEERNDGTGARARRKYRDHHARKRGSFAADGAQKSISMGPPQSLRQESSQSSNAASTRPPQG